VAVRIAGSGRDAVMRLRRSGVRRDQPGTIANILASLRSFINRPALGGGVRGRDISRQVVEKQGGENSGDCAGGMVAVDYPSRLARSISFQRDENPRLVPILPECDTEQVLRNIGRQTFRVAAIVLEFPFV
jgi:hypothetical protein